MSRFYTQPALSVNGEVAEAAELNNVNIGTDTGFILVAAEIDAQLAAGAAQIELARKWAEELENVPVTPGAFSAFHWATKAVASAAAAATSAGAALASQNAAAASASTATTQAGISTTKAVISTNQANISTAQAVISTAQAGISTTKASEAAASAVLTAADRVQTGLDRVQTGSDRAQTGLDRVATGQDKVATAADRVQTGLDKIATAADLVQTNLDTIDTAADLVQTNLDTIATAADRVQTGLDVISADASAIAAAASAATAFGDTGYPEVQPSLLLNFSQSKSLDPRITFSRASKETYTNEKGLLAYAAIDEPAFDHDPVTGECKGLAIWEQRTNLAKYSEDYNDVIWVKTGITVTPNTIIAPDGTLSANTILCTQADGTLNCDPAGSIGSIYTVSFWLKRKTGNGLVYIRTLGNANTLITITDQWQRYSVTSVAAVTTTIRIGLRLGTVGDEVYTWGAQLEAGSFPTPYIPSTNTFISRASTGTYIGSDGLIKTAAINEPRMQYNPERLDVEPKLLLEESRTNLLTYSEDFGNIAWSKSNSTISADVATAPDGSGTADKLVENTVNNVHHCSRDITLSPTTVTLSFFVSAAGRTKFRLGFSDLVFGGPAVRFDLSDLDFAAPVLSGPWNNVTSAIARLPNGIYRASITATATRGTAVRCYCYLEDSGGNVSYQGDGTSGLYIWGAQLEAGSYPTSYIPTTTAAVTRAADISSSAAATRAADIAVMTGSNFSDWYRQEEGSFVCLFRSGDDLVSTKVFFVFEDILNYIGVAGTNSAGAGPYGSIGVNGVTQASLTDGSETPNTEHTVGLSYKTNDVAYCLDGRAVKIDIVAGIPHVTQLKLGSFQDTYLNSHIANLAYYPKAISDSELQIITQI